jgi:glycosyltransferase involved in cell wall biosynthesis
MFQSVLIPHRDRNKHLGLCLWALNRSARLLGISQWEAVVIDCGSRTLPQCHGPNIQVIQDRNAPKEFNKSRAYNLGIEAARGDVLTFLDADAVVGRQFMKGMECLADSALDRCCYRVRYLPKEEAGRMEPMRGRDAYVDRLFANYDDYRIGLEAYGSFHQDIRQHPKIGGEPWGNSQFSITRKNLGDIRYDEKIGWGIEDVDMNMMLQAKFGPDYRALIFTDEKHAMFHLEHPTRPWNNNGFLASRRRIHKRKRKELLGW